MLHLLDTDIASYIIKERSQPLKRRLEDIEPHSIAISTITRAELVYGLKRLAPEHRLHALVHEFLASIQTVPWTSDAADEYAAVRHQLTSEGRPIGQMDMMIAGHALALRATLVTNNTRHFERIAAPLLLTNWLD